MDDDQTVMLLAYRRNPELFLLRECDWHHGLALMSPQQKFTLAPSTTTYIPLNRIDMLYYRFLKWKGKRQSNRAEQALYDDYCQRTKKTLASLKSTRQK